MPLPQTFGAFMFSDIDRGRDFYDSDNFESQLIHSYLPVPITGLFGSGQIGQAGRRALLQAGKDENGDASASGSGSGVGSKPEPGLIVSAGKRLGQAGRKTLLNESSTVIGVLRATQPRPPSPEAPPADAPAEREQQ